MQAPFNSGSEYFNYKGTFSIVLLAVVDANYKFICVNVGCQGRISDGGVFKNMSFYKKLINNELNLPDDTSLPGRQMPVPYVFVADDAFPLLKHLIKPFSGYQPKGSRERTFNYRVSRARIRVENTFGIIASVFRVLRKPILLQERTASSLVLTCIHLHNFLRRNESARLIYNPPGSFDTFDKQTGELIPGEWRADGNCNGSFLPLNNRPRKSADDVKKIRNEFADFVLTPDGKLS